MGQLVMGATLRDLVDYWPVFTGFIFIIGLIVSMQSDIKTLKSNDMILQKAIDDKTTTLDLALRELKTSEAEKDKALWLKIEGLQATMNQVLIAIGELKGRIERNT